MGATAFRIAFTGSSESASSAFLLGDPMGRRFATGITSVSFR